LKNIKGGMTVFYYFWLLMLILLTVQDAYPLSFRLYDQGARAQAQAGAFTAQASDASSVYYNPAALSGLESQALGGAELIYFETEYDSLSGVSETSDNEWKILPHVYISQRLGKQWAVGFGTYSLFGLATEYSDRGPLRYAAASTELKIVDMNPVISYQVNPWLAVGGGIDITAGELDIRRKVDFGKLAGTPGSLDGDFQLDVDGQAFTFNLGILVTPHEQHRFGVMVHGPMDLEVDGSAVINNVPAFVGVGSSVTGNASTELNLPMIVRVGYAYQHTPKWTLEVDYEWTDFSRFESLDIASANPLFLDTTIPQNHEDSHVIALGTQYELNKHWALRGGYGHVFDAVPDTTFSPSIPTANRNFFTVGFGYKTCCWTLDFGYQFILFDERDIDNDVGANVGTTVDGTYDSFVHGVTVDARVNF
jgi:long-chain fatty acid transport protein